MDQQLTTNLYKFTTRDGPLGVGQPLHTLIVSYLHPCEAALAARLVPGLRAPHLERDRAKFLMYWLDNPEVLSVEVYGVEDANFVLVAAAAIGDVACMLFALERGATLTTCAALAAAKMGQLQCLRVLLSHHDGWTATIGRDLYLEACASRNEEGSLACLQYLHPNGPLPIAPYPDMKTCLVDTCSLRRCGWEAMLAAGFSIHAIGLETSVAACAAAARSGSIQKFDREYASATQRGIRRLSDRDYSAVLDAAAFWGHLTCLKRLRQYDPAYRNPGMVGYGHVAAVAALRGHYPCAKWAIEVAGPLANHYENRVFQHAAEAGSIECMELALETERVNAVLRGDGPIHVSDWFITAKSVRALESIHKLCAERLEFKDYACAMWQAVRHHPDNIPVLARWFDAVKTGLVDGLLRVAAKFNRVAALVHLKTIGATKFRIALTCAGAEAAILLRKWIHEHQPTDQSWPPRNPQCIRFPPTFWKYGYLL